MMSSYERAALALIDRLGRDEARRNQKDLVAHLLVAYDNAVEAEASGHYVGNGVHSFYEELSYAEGVLEAIDYIGTEPGD